MRQLVATVIILLSGVLHGFAADTYHTQWQKGNNFYQQHQYDSAAWYFEQIAALKPQNEAVYYNLGNTYYKLNRVALAVLNYERALKINPDNKEATDNLALAQSRISNHLPVVPEIFFIRWWQNITKATNASMWAIAALILFILIIVVVCFRRFKKTGRANIPPQLTGVLFFSFICFLILAVGAAKNIEQNARAVVMQTDAPLMNNDLKGKPLALIPEGTTIKIISERNDWAEVSLPDGRNGWVQLNLVEKI